MSNTLITLQGVSKAFQTATGPSWVLDRKSVV